MEIIGQHKAKHWARLKRFKKEHVLHNLGKDYETVTLVEEGMKIYKTLRK